jgi:hypothetical protein
VVKPAVLMVENVPKSMTLTGNCISRRVQYQHCLRHFLCQCKTVALKMLSAPTQRLLFNLSFDLNLGEIWPPSRMIERLRILRTTAPACVQHFPRYGSPRYALLRGCFRTRCNTARGSWFSAVMTVAGWFVCAFGAFSQGRCGRDLV